MIEFIGIVSGILVLFGYFGNSFKFLNTVQYGYINLFAASGAVVYLYTKDAMVSVVLNIIWAGIALFTLVREWYNLSKAEN